MEPRHPLERIRAWAAGELAPDERLRFERDLASDPELAQLAHAYRDVHALTALDEGVPDCAASLENIERRMSPTRPWRRVAALAAGILVLASAALVSRGLFRSEPELGPLEPVTLASIPLEVDPDRYIEALPIPATLASFHPVREEGIQWIHELDEAREIAWLTNRPLLVFARYEVCPVADRLRKTTLIDDRVLALAEECVPCEVDIEGFLPDDTKKMLAYGYPFFELQEGKGTVISNFSGDYPGDVGAWNFHEVLREGLDDRKDGTSPIPWSLSRDLADLHARARAGEEEGRFGDARRFYEELVASGTSGGFVESGQRGILRIALAARDVLIEVRTLALADLDAAEDELAAALERFRGTPHANDIEGVLRCIQTRHEFPPLDWSS